MVSTLLLVTAACGGERGQPPREEPYRLTGRSCLRALATRHLPSEPWAAPGSRACRVDTPRVAAGTERLSFTPPLETSCALLVAWADYERQLDAAARRILGSGIARVSHYGSHACRAMSGNAGRYSLHARARAIDIAGFTLRDGRRVDVRRDYRAWGAPGRFLRAAAAAACRTFSVVLTPRTDRAHADHLHLDIGPWRQCDA